MSRSTRLRGRTRAVDCVIRRRKGGRTQNTAAIFIAVVTKTRNGRIESAAERARIAAFVKWCALSSLTYLTTAITMHRLSIRLRQPFNRDSVWLRQCLAPFRGKRHEPETTHQQPRRRRYGHGCDLRSFVGHVYQRA